MARQGSSSSRRESSFELYEANFKTATVKKYKAAVVDFVEWLEATDAFCDTLEDLDTLAVRYIHKLYRRDRTRSNQAGVNLRYGLTMVLPALRRRGMPCTDFALAGWKKLRPGKSYPPMPAAVAQAVAGHLSMEGDFRTGVAVLLAFECYLRCGELLALRRSDVSFPDHVRSWAGAEATAAVDPVLRLRATKTGRDQSVTIRDPDVSKLLKIVVDETERGGLLFPYSPHQFRRLFKDSCKELGVGQVGFVLHSLRHGGATRDYQHRRLGLEDIMTRGRWASPKSAKRYIQLGVGLMLANDLPDEILNIVKLLAVPSLAGNLIKLRAAASAGQ